MAADRVGGTRAAGQGPGAPPPGTWGPRYTVEDDGPDHAKTFTEALSLAGTVYGRGGGRTKKAAEREVAEAAYRALAAEEDPAAA
ncbi:putative dsRNA-binding protein [Geodermatophilus sp. URMC 61]|uniref:putative dsRNA-binding protein n=1 Tax=Geodermatophilus sp. URMC 61 TaxID=3423411 RepID=UPI00406CA335